MLSISPVLCALILSTGAALGSDPGLPGGTEALSSGGLLWSYGAGNGQATVAIGDRGGQVLVRGGADRLRLLSAFDANPPAPIWTAAVPLALDPLAASQETGDYVHASYQVVGAFSVQATLRKFSSSSALPAWTRVFRAQSISVPAYDISRDGGTIVSALYDESQAALEICSYDPGSGAVAAQMQSPFPGFVGRFDLSPDGSTVAHGSSDGTGSTHVLDLATGTELLSTAGSLPSRQGLSDGGQVLVVREDSGGAWHVRVLASQGGTYQQVLDLPSPSTEVPQDMAVSDDGSVVVVAWFDTALQTRAILRAYAVASASLTMERVIDGTGLQNLPSDVALSADGAVFVAGLWGDGAGTVAELALYSSTQSLPLAEYPSSGSVFGVDIAADGRRFVASRAATHANNGYTSTRAELYAAGGEDLVAHGKPRIGASVSFDLHGTPGASAFLLSSTALAVPPVPFGGGGLLHLDRSALSMTPMGIVPASGLISLTLPLPSDPALIGSAIHFQGLTTGPGLLTHDWVQLTLLP